MIGSVEGSAVTNSHRLSIHTENSHSLRKLMGATRSRFAAASPPQIGFGCLDTQWHAPAEKMWGRIGKRLYHPT